jgi:signal transduction histidine kinase
VASSTAPPGTVKGWTTRRWVTAGITVTAVLLAVLASLGAWVFARSSSTSDHLVYTTTPALITAAELEQSLTDEETGSRGYGLSGQRSFLQPYQDGLKDEKAAVARLRVLLPAGSPGADELTRTLAAGEAWKARFGRPVAQAAPADAVGVASARADSGKTAFDSFRTASARLQATLRDDQAHGRSELARVRTERNWIFSLIAAVVVALLTLIAVGLRRALTAPLGDLTRDVRRVARGEFRHVVRGSGPADLRQLARDVESMRQRLVDELAFTDAARERLDEQATDLRRSNAELEQFAYVASHDLQEPLRKVASFCQLLQRRYADQLDERAGQYIEFAVDGANRMQTLINDLLAFSRVGRLHTDSEGVDLEEVFARAGEAISMAVEDTGAELVHDPLPQVVGDRTQLAMLFQNVLSNAIKFRRADVPPRVEVSCRLEDGFWRFAVTDNGIGIAPEYAEKVFVIFQRLHTRDAYPGNGIGLALCKKIVEYHGGAIGIDTGYDQGTRITFTLPVAEPHHTAGTPHEAAAAAGAGNGAGAAGRAGNGAA